MARCWWVGLTRRPRWSVIWPQASLRGALLAQPGGFKGVARFPIPAHPHDPLAAHGPHAGKSLVYDDTALPTSSSRPDEGNHLVSTTARTTLAFSCDIARAVSRSLALQNSLWGLGSAATSSLDSQRLPSIVLSMFIHWNRS
jgi:hypothetical protein